ncbi:hypothetical protein M422DRAFT_266785 [Sphaerobolus stellatus SS14]|uniref:Uncharacterized protein n=1 Tax=Sphaerobolus stellatus (strain SS14) TaxID=990650 RepID=A0A0C9UQZ1_SPHS4|nr:hypothetical protein M422DRAFT_266785 [Sphaerobolus stellatus SS14]
MGPTSVQITPHASYAGSTRHGRPHSHQTTPPYVQPHPQSRPSILIPSVFAKSSHHDPQSSSSHPSGIGGDSLPPCLPSLRGVAGSKDDPASAPAPPLSPGLDL